MTEQEFDTLADEVCYVLAAHGLTNGDAFAFHCSMAMIMANRVGFAEDLPGIFTELLKVNAQ